MYMKSIELGLYRHYKGNEYKVVGVARHSETLGELVIYGSATEMWARPYEMFFENVEYNGETVKRFEKIDE